MSLVSSGVSEFYFTKSLMNSEWLWAQRPVGENWICPKLEGPGHILRPIRWMKTNSIKLLSLKSVTSLRLEVLELWGLYSFKIQRVLKLKNFIRNVSISFWLFYSRYFFALIQETLPQKVQVFLIVFCYIQYNPDNFISESCF